MYLLIFIIILTVINLFKVMATHEFAAEFGTLEEYNKQSGKMVRHIIFLMIEIIVLILVIWKGN